MLLYVTFDLFSWVFIGFNFFSLLLCSSINFHSFLTNGVCGFSVQKMSRAILRGVSGLRISGNSHDSWDSQMKVKTDREDYEKNRPSDHTCLSFKLFPDNSSSKHGIHENGFVSDTLIAGSPRSRHKLTMLALKLSLVLILVLALAGSFWWTISITSSSRGQIIHSHGYRRLYEQLVSDLWDIGELSLGPARFKELEFCPSEYENHVPCFNVSKSLELGNSDGEEFTRHCGPGPRQNCLVPPPVNYKIPLRWPTGRDIIWLANVKISAQEVLSSGSLTKR